MPEYASLPDEAALARILRVHLGGDLQGEELSAAPLAGVGADRG
jgi:hypothetical protein